MSGEHARIKPSSAYQWAFCAGSIRLQEIYPETGNNEAAEEGNAAHWVGATILADFLECGRKGHHFNRDSFLDKPAPNGVLVTDEMLDAVEVYVRDVMATSTRFQSATWVLLEHRVRMPSIHPENWGTLDNAVLFFDPNCDTMVVSDYKHGWELVEVHENWQLIDYTAGLINDLWERQLPMPAFVEFRLVQPRPHHRDGQVRVWKVPLHSLKPYFEHLSRMAHEALGDSPRTVPGPWCTYCTGRHGCQALRESVYAAITLVSGATPSELDATALGTHLTMLKRVLQLVGAQYTGYETQALALIQQGKGVPGWWTERPEGRLKWSKPIEEVLLLGDLLKKDLRKPQVKTPTQAIEAGIPAELIASYADRTAGTIKLVPANLKKSAAIFGATKQ